MLFFGIERSVFAYSSMSLSDIGLRPMILRCSLARLTSDSTFWATLNGFSFDLNSRRNSC